MQRYKCNPVRSLPQEVDVGVGHKDRVPMIHEVASYACGQAEPVIQLSEEQDASVRTLMVGIELCQDRLRGDFWERTGC